MGLVVKGVFSVGFDDKIGHRTGFKNGLTFQFFAGFRLKDSCASLRSPHIKFFKRQKKEKKESRFISGGFKKVKFFYKKILPDACLETEA